MAYMTKAGLPALEDLVLEGVKIKGVPNFSGQERRNPKTGDIVNSKGSRNCLIVLDPDKAEELRALGWPVQRKVDSNGEYDAMTIHLGYTIEPYKIAYVLDGKVTTLYSRMSSTAKDEDNVNMLDRFQISHLNVKLHASAYNVSGNKGYKAWIQVMYAYAESIDPWETVGGGDIAEEQSMNETAPFGMV